MFRKLINILTGSGRTPGTPFIGLAFEFRNTDLNVEAIGFAYELLEEFGSLGLSAEQVVKHIQTEIAVSEVTQDYPKLEFHGSVFAEAVLEALEFVHNGDSGALQQHLEVSPGLLSATHDGAGIPLLAASASGFSSCVELLLAHGAEVNAIGPLGMLPLHWAAALNHSDVVEALVNAGADREAMNWSLLTAPELAMANRGSESRLRMHAKPKKPDYHLVLSRMMAADHQLHP